MMIIFTIILLLLQAGFVKAEKKVYKLTIYGDTKYTDNLYLSDENKKDDIIIKPGLIFYTERSSKISNFNFSYNLGRTFYLSENDNNAFQHNLSLSYSRHFSKRFSCSLSSNYYRTENVIEPNEEVFRERRKREPYYRINSSISFSYEYWKDSFFTFGSSVNYLQNEDPTVEDSRIYSEYISFSRDFVRFFVYSKISFFQREFEETKPVDTHSTYLSLGYKLAHNKHISLDLSADRTQDKDPKAEDYWAYTFGTSYVWSPEKTQTYHFHVGYYLRDVDGEGNDKGITFSINYLKRYRFSSYSISGSGGYRYEYGEADNRGFTKYYNISFSFQRRFSRYLSFSSSVFYRIEDFKERYSKTTKTYGFSFSLNKKLTKHIDLAIGYSYRKADSDFSQDDYEVNNLIATVSYTGEIWKSREFPLHLWPF